MFVCVWSRVNVIVNLPFLSFFLSFSFSIGSLSPKRRFKRLRHRPPPPLRWPPSRRFLLFSFPFPFLSSFLTLPLPAHFQEILRLAEEGYRVLVPLFPDPLTEFEDYAGFSLSLSLSFSLSLFTTPSSWGHFGSQK